ncbi:cytochrome P450 [Trichoderma austrokoningii]
MLLLESINTFLKVIKGLLNVLYNLLFSPFAKFPGPFLAKFTNLYSAYHAFKGDLHLDIKKCHQKYGKWIKMKETYLPCADIYGVKSNVRKSKGYNAFQEHPEDKNILSVIDKQEHNQKKRVLAPALAMHAVKQNFEPSILKIIREFCDILSEGQIYSSLSSCSQDKGKWSEPMNMTEWMSYLSIDLMAKVVFGLELDTLTQAKYRSLPSLITQTFFLVSILIESIAISTWRLDAIFFRNAEKSRQDFRSLLKDILLRRIQHGQDIPQVDILQSWLRGFDPKTGSGLKPRQLASEAGVLIVAGSHTVGTTLASFLYYLSTNPAVYARATQEVRKTFATGEEIVTGPLLQSCSYLQACIDETLRKAPPNAVPLWRDVQDGGAMIDGTFLPAGTTVGVAGYSLHHNDKYFANPATFDPERWMPNNPQEHVARRACAPFSIGPRSCMGKNIALTEVMLTAAHILWALDFKRADEAEDDTVSKYQAWAFSFS